MSVESLEDQCILLENHAFCEAYGKSDHHLVIAKIKLQLCRSGKKVNVLKKYNMAKPKVSEVAQKFKIKL